MKCFRYHLGYYFTNNTYFVQCEVIVLYVIVCVTFLSFYGLLRSLLC